MAAFLRGFVDHVHAHQGVARTLATLMTTRSGALAEGGRALELAVTELIDAAVAGGAARTRPASGRSACRPATPGDGPGRAGRAQGRPRGGPAPSAAPWSW
ncbi:hypothetical protein ACU635_32890 [[Actinomadura] parvosata]|uniref:hypothetical protein n=1 Tax=[Actinomadura] parvosata TaxID=1955412 RepID=UPI00406CF535